MNLAFESDANDGRWQYRVDFLFVAGFFQKGSRFAVRCHLSRKVGRARSRGDAERRALQKPSAMAPATAGQRIVLKGVYPRHFFSGFYLRGSPLSKGLQLARRRPKS